MQLTVTRSTAAEIPKGALVTLENHGSEIIIYDSGTLEPMATLENAEGEFFRVDHHTGIRLTGFCKVNEFDYVKVAIEAG